MTLVSVTDDAPIVTPRDMVDVESIEWTEAEFPERFPMITPAGSTPLNTTFIDAKTRMASSRDGTDITCPRSLALSERIKSGVIPLAIRIAGLGGIAGIYYPCKPGYF